MKPLLFIFLLLSTFWVKAQTISTIAGTGSSVFSGEGAFATAAGIPNPNKGVFDKLGNFYFPDGMNSNRVRKITPEGIVTTVAGNGMGGFAGDGGLATAAMLNSPIAVAFDSAENLYIADGQNFRIRKVDKATGIITTVAGNGTGGYSGDGGVATMASMWAPIDVVVDTFGNIFVADGNNFRVRKIDAFGVITTYAGVGTNGFSGDGGPAISAELSAPSGLAFDVTGNLYIADVGGFGNRVRKVSLSGTISTFTGNGSASYTGDGIPATTASMAPSRICFDKDNNLFIADRFNNRVYRVGVDGILHSIAGTGVAGDSGDGGPASSATVNYPTAVAVDACGNLYVSTVGSISVPGSGRRIRKITFNPLSTPTITVSAVSAAPLGSTVTVSATVAGAGSTYSIKWFNKGVLFASTTAPTVTYTKVHTVDSITARIVPAVTYCYDSTTSAVHVVTRSGVGVSDLSQGSDFFIYPNPARTALYVSGQGTGHITVSNLLGQPVLSAAYAAGKAELNVAALPAGVYTVRISGSSGAQQVFKWVKE